MKKKTKDFELVEQRAVIQFHIPPEAFRGLMRQLAETAKEDVSKVEAMIEKETDSEKKEQLNQLLAGRKTLMFLYEDAVTLAEWAQSKIQSVKPSNS